MNNEGIQINIIGVNGRRMKKTLPEDASFITGAVFDGAERISVYNSNKNRIMKLSPGTVDNYSGCYTVELEDLEKWSELAKLKGDGVDRMEAFKHGNEKDCKTSQQID